MAVADVDYDAIARRPYYDAIYAPDGQLLCEKYTGGHLSGPLAYAGQHPTDFFGAIDHPGRPGCGLATRNCE